MVQINFAKKEINLKLVYYGPGMSGKTTNLEMIHQKAPKENKGELTAIATEGDRTLFFDFLPLDLGKVKGMNTKFHLYTVPGQVYYASTRKLVLQGADGVIFVADSRKVKLEENIESLKDMEKNLTDYGIDIKTFPLVIQWNKRDLPDAGEISWLNEKINWLNAPTTESVAARGEGVMSTLKLAARMVMSRLNEQEGLSPQAPKASSAPAAPTEKKDDAVARINGDRIGKAYFLNYCQIQYRLNAQGEVEEFKKLSDKEKEAYLESLITHAVLMNEARKSGFTLDKKQIESQIAGFVKKFGSQEKFNQYLSSRFLSLDNVKNEAIKNIVINWLLKERVPDYLTRLEVGGDEAREYYESHSEAFPGEMEKHQARIAQILKNKKKKRLLDGLFAELRAARKIEIFKDKL